MSTPWTEIYKAAASGVSDIVEEEGGGGGGEGKNSSELFEINHGVSLVSIKEEAESSLFSSPLGMLPKSQVSPTQVEKYMAQERDKRVKLLDKFLHICSASKVKVDTVLIESDMVATAILDLIPILNIRKLVVGTTNSNSNPRKLKSRRTRSTGIADQICRSAPNTCDVKVVCEGKEVITQMIGSPSHSSSPLGNEDYFKSLQGAENRQKADDNSFACCFKGSSRKTSHPVRGDSSVGRASD